MNGKLGAPMRRATRISGIVLGLLLAAAAAAAQGSWYAEKYRAGDVPVSVEQLWSRGPLFRSETVINGHPIVNLVVGDRYVIIDRLTGKGVSIVRHPKAVREAEAGRRPFGNELTELTRAGGEFVRQEDFAGNRCDLYRLTSHEGRREVCATTDDEKLPVLTRVWMRRTQRQAESRYVNWTRQVDVPESFFAPDPRIPLQEITYQEYVDRAPKDLELPAPPLYHDLLHGTR